MSLDTLIGNPILLNELAEALEVKLPDTGITSITNTDGNLVPVVTGRAATINFASSLSTGLVTVNTGLITSGPAVFNGAANFTGVVQLSSQAGTSGQVLTSQGGTVPIWTTPGTVGGNISVSGINISNYIELNGSKGTSGQILTSQGNSAPIWADDTGSASTVVANSATVINGVVNTTYLTVSPSPSSLDVTILLPTNAILGDRIRVTSAFTYGGTVTITQNANQVIVLGSLAGAPVVTTVGVGGSIQATAGQSFVVTCYQASSVWVVSEVTQPAFSTASIAMTYV